MGKKGVALLKKCIHHSVVTPFVAMHGRSFEPADFPTTYRRGKLNACFANSFFLMRRHGLTYVEGYAQAYTDMDHAHAHAWCIDGKGRVVDPTWKRGVSYFGVPFQNEFLLALMKERKRRCGDDMYYGVLDDWTIGFPLIKRAYGPPAKWLFTP